MSQRPCIELSDWLLLLDDLGVDDDALIALADEIDSAERTVGDADVESIRRVLLYADNAEIGWLSLKESWGVVTKGDAAIGASLLMDERVNSSQIHVHFENRENIFIDGQNVNLWTIGLLAQSIHDYHLGLSDIHPVERCDLALVNLAKMGLRYTEEHPGVGAISPREETWISWWFPSSPLLIEILSDAFSGAYGERAKMHLKVLISDWLWPDGLNWQYRDHRAWVTLDLSAWRKSFGLLAQIVRENAVRITVHSRGFTVTSAGARYTVKPAAKNAAPHQEPYLLTKAHQNGTREESVCIHTEQSSLPLGDILVSLLLMLLQSQPFGQAGLNGRPQPLPGGV